MIAVLIILYIVLFIINIIFLVKSIKSKDNKNWIITFSINISSIISTLLVGIYSLFNHYMNWECFKYLLICFLTLGSYLILLIIGFIFKVVEIQKNKKLNIVTQKLDKKIKYKSFLIPFLIILLLTSGVCFVNYFSYVINKRGELTSYDSIKEKEINKMVDFLNNKYNLNIKSNSCVYYREQDYSRHTDIFGNGGTFDIPYLAVFNYNDEPITVADRKGFISDNKQLMEIYDLLIDYYYKKTGIKFDFIEFSKSYSGKSIGNSNIINSILQTKFNSLITDLNIEQFLDYILKEPDLYISFYINDSYIDDKETLIYDLTNKLMYLKDYTNIEILEVNGHEEPLDIKYKKINFPSEQKNYGISSEDIYDSYKFGVYYVDTSINNFTFTLRMDLDRGYSSYGEPINGWRYSTLK